MGWIDMALLTRLFAPRRRKNQQEIAGRAAEVIDHVIFDVGVDRFVNGTLLLDKEFRLRFYGVAPASDRDVLASIAVRELEEARAFRALVNEATVDTATLNLHTDRLVLGLMRELRARSPALRALPSQRQRNAKRGILAAS
jgi:hypothetical protein